MALVGSQIKQLRRLGVRFYQAVIELQYVVMKFE